MDCEYGDRRQILAEILTLVFLVDVYLEIGDRKRLLIFRIQGILWKSDPLAHSEVASTSL